jgi:hypothetical protein
MVCRIFMIFAVLPLVLPLLFVGPALNGQDTTGKEKKLGAATKRSEGTIHTEAPALEASRASAAPKSDAADSCPLMYSEREAVSAAKSWGIRSPDRQRLAWSAAVLQKDPELVRGQVFLRNERTGQRETIFVTRTKGGKITTTSPDYPDPNYNLFCVIDWSPDSNYLLVREVLGYMSSDVWLDSYWLHNRARSRRELIDLKPVKQAIERHWKKRGLDFRDVNYQSLAIGWERGKANRIVLMVFTFHQEPTLFLGIWSVTSTGRQPNLLAEKEDGVIVDTYGQIIAPPE